MPSLLDVCTKVLFVAGFCSSTIPVFSCELCAFIVLIIRCLLCFTELGFLRVTDNSMDAVSDRDFVG